MTGNVDDGDPALALRGREIEPGEPELGRDPARLLDGKPIGIDPRQSADQRRLAVVDVTRGPEDDRVPHTDNPPPVVLTPAGSAELPPEPSPADDRTAPSPPTQGPTATGRPAPRPDTWGGL